MSQPPETQWHVLNLLNWTRGYLSRAGLDSPRLSAELLLAHCMRCDRIDLYTRHDYQPTDVELGEFRRLVLRAAAHEPVAYLIGRKEFYSLPFRVTQDVLIPRPETELLAGEAISHLRSLGRPGTMWDVCTGCGAVAVAVAWQLEDISVLATDVSAAAIAVAEQNAKANGVGGRVRFVRADLLDLTEDQAAPKTFDIITANPPYVADDDEVAEEVRYEPAVALRAGEDGLDFIRRIVAGAPAFLAAGGVLAMEFGCGQADAVRDLLVAGGRFEEPRILRDHQNIERVALAARI